MEAVDNKIIYDSSQGVVWITSSQTDSYISEEDEYYDEAEEENDINEKNDGFYDQMSSSVSSSEDEIAVVKSELEELSKMNSEPKIKAEVVSGSEEEIDAMGYADMFEVESDSKVFEVKRDPEVVEVKIEDSEMVKVESDSKVFEVKRDPEVVEVKIEDSEMVKVESDTENVDARCEFLLSLEALNGCSKTTRARSRRLRLRRDVTNCECCKTTPKLRQYKSRGSSAKQHLPIRLLHSKQITHEQTHTEQTSSKQTTSKQTCSEHSKSRRNTLLSDDGASKAFFNNIRNEEEKKRRKELSADLQNLATVIPVISDVRNPAQISVLTAAVDYIKELNYEEKELSQQLIDLVSKNWELRKQVKS